MKDNKNKQFIVRVTEETKNNFDKYCEETGFSPSKRLRVLIENDVNGKLIINNK